MDDARPAHATYAREAAAAMGQQGVDQGVVGIARRGMDHHAGRLVQHQEIGVLIEDVQGARLRQRLGGLGLGNVDNEAFARFDLAGRLFHCPPWFI